MNRGAIIVWNDIAPEGRAEFYDWHIHEHIPERVGIPGFHSGRRYVAATSLTLPEFLTLYETAGAWAALSAPYLERLNAPTPGTKSATAHFRNTSRALCEVIASAGEGLGGTMGTIRFGATPQGRAALTAVRAAGIAGIAALPRVTSVRLCATDTSASGVKTTESRDRTDIQAPPIGALLIEGCDAEAVQAGHDHLVRTCNLESARLAFGIYRLEHSRSSSVAI
jgi:hypothetical protein